MNAPASDTLLALLADTARAGVRPLPIGSADRLLAAATQLGYCARSIDLGACADKAALLQRMADALDFPQWFGHNWDALADSLGDLSWVPAPGYVLLLRHAADLRNRHPKDFGIALDILREASLAWAEQRVPFWAFLDLAAPAGDGTDL